MSIIRSAFVRNLFCIGLVGIVLTCNRVSAQEIDTCYANNLIDLNAKVELVVGGFQFTEGPVSDKNGNVYFSDIPASRIYKWSVENHQLSVFREHTGRANGLRFDHKGDLLACEGAARQVTATYPDKTVVVLADQYHGRKLNSPNDLWVDPKGGVYFSDPRYPKAKWVWSDSDGKSDNSNNAEDKEEQDARGVYYISPNKKFVSRVAKFSNPNGIIGTENGKKLYVSDTGVRKIYVFQIKKNGTLSDKKVFLSEYADGMALDKKRDIYLANRNVKIYSSKGSFITTIKVPETVSNIGFGGKEHKTLFITAGHGLYAVKMRVRGQ